jgi:hypothetical protein
MHTNLQSELDLSEMTNFGEVGKMRAQMGCAILSPIAAALQSRFPL